MKKVDFKKIFNEMKKFPVFYQKVWKACMKIPPGEVRSYKWLAQRIGMPKAYRAVALALKKNPFAPYVPCHRVIRSDGSIGGYSAPGGIRKKKMLLKKELLFSERKKNKIRKF